MSDEPKWLTRARQDLGLQETPGKATTPYIRRWLIELGAWWTDDETPWCGVACAAWLKDSGLEIPKHYYRARAWLDWGRPMHAVPGAVIVFERGAGGHVGLIVGVDQADRLLVLGGNQGNRVSIAPFTRSRILGIRWPKDSSAVFAHLPLIRTNQAASTAEA